MVEWTDDAHSQIRALWAEGLSVNAIGRRMGISKNAVVGKVHRLCLPGRPSPVQRGPNADMAERNARIIALVGSGMTQKEAAERVGASANVVYEVMRKTRPQQGARIRRPVSLPPLASKEAPREWVEPVAPPPPVVLFKPSRPRQCCWPMWGNQQRPTHVYCTADAEPGQSYCLGHCQAAFVGYHRKQAA